jgi:hypothetical protein
MRGFCYGRASNMRKYYAFCAVLIVTASIIAATLVRTWSAPRHSAAATTQQTNAIVRKASEAVRLVDLPVVAPVQYLPITASEALALNAKQLRAGDVGPPAAPFRDADTPANLARAAKCLTEAVYYEAASQELAGQRAVAQVVLNRVRNPAFPASVCGVVYQGAERVTGCQFTFTCDGSLSRTISRRAWMRAQQVATAALAGFVFRPVGYSTHYHANWVVPYWASSLVRATSIGAHIFYRWNGRWGESKAFQQRYAGIEPETTWTHSAREVAGSLNTDALAPLSTPVAELATKTIPVDDLKVYSSLAADRATHGSTLRLDERPARLIASLESKPQIVLDPFPGGRSASLGEQRRTEAGKRGR